VNNRGSIKSQSIKCSTVLVVPKSEKRFIDEIIALVREAGYEPIHVIYVSESNSACYLGKGKLDELAKLTADNNLKSVVIYDDVKPRHVFCLKKRLGFDVEILDKTLLILKIFESHAGSRDAKIQIELARLRHTLPIVKEFINKAKTGELPGFLSSGEYLTESYYKHIRRRISRLTKELEYIRRVREQTRDNQSIAFIRVAITGYTNSGKTSLFNALTNLNKPTGTELFTTLTPKSYVVKICSTKIMFIDTIGFVRGIPVGIVEAFRAVLEEINFSDIVILVLDVSDNDEYMKEKLDSAISILKNLGSLAKPLIVVANKMDLVDEQSLNRKLKIISDHIEHMKADAVIVPISALKRLNLDLLKRELCRIASKLQQTSNTMSMSSE